MKVYLRGFESIVGQLPQPLVAGHGVSRLEKTEKFTLLSSAFPRVRAEFCVEEANVRTWASILRKRIIFGRIAIGSPDGRN